LIAANDEETVVLWITQVSIQKLTPDKIEIQNGHIMKN